MEEEERRGSVIWEGDFFHNSAVPFFSPQKLNSAWRLARLPRLSGTCGSGLLISCCCVSLVGMGPVKE